MRSESQSKASDEMVPMYYNLSGNVSFGFPSSLTLTAATSNNEWSITQLLSTRVLMQSLNQQRGREEERRER